MSVEHEINNNRMLENNYQSYSKHLKKTFIDSERQYDVYANYFYKNIYKFLPEDKSSKIVDLGCGFGHILYFLKKEKYFNSYGIDTVRENIEVCKSKDLNAAHEDINDYIKDYGNKADVFILSNVLEHFDYQAIVRVVDSLFGLLNKGGTILIILPNCNNISGLATYFSDITHKSPLTEKSLEDLILKTSFKTYYFYNLIVYPNIIFLDFIIKIYNKFVFTLRKLNNMINGQKPFCVQSKNLLAVLKREI